MKVIIVGGVAGGASAAARIRRLDEHAEILMLERGPYISYANCGLPYYVGGVITDKHALTLQTPASFQSRFNVQVRVEHEVLSIQPDNRTVTVRELQTGREYTESYDKLLLSPGAEPVVPDLPGKGDPRIFTLRNVPDTYRIREYITQQKPACAVVVGGGYIGLEMAENLVHAGLEVAVAEFADHVIGPLDGDAAREVEAYLRAKGIRLYLSNGVKAYHPQDNGIQVELSDGTLCPADMVILSVGVRPESKLAKDAGLALGERNTILVDDRMCTSDPHIFAVGDAVQAVEYVSDKPGYLPLAGPANKMGRIAADNICGLDSRYRGTQGSSILKLFDMTVACTGMNERAAKAAGLDYDKIYTYSPNHATYYPGAVNMSIKLLFARDSGKILGAQLVGFSGVDKRCDVLATAIRGGMTAQNLTELELCYAPPFSSAKDPVNMAGYAVENILMGKVTQFHWHDVEEIRKLPDAVFLDVRTPEEYALGHISGAINMPLDQLRESLAALDSSKTYYVNCRSGQRSYIACRILTQRGFVCRNLSGGYHLYEAVVGK